MKRFFLATLLALAGAAQAQTGPYSMFLYDVGGLGYYLPIGSGVTLTAGVIAFPGMTQVNSDWSASSGVAQILNKPTIPTILPRSFAYPTRALNTCFQVSSTRDALVSYGVDVTTTLTLTNGGQGSAALRTYTDSGCSLGGQTIVSGTSGLPATLTVTVGLQNLGTVVLGGVAPAGLWERLETTTNVGTVTFAARQGQETLL